MSVHVDCDYPHLDTLRNSDISGATVVKERKKGYALNVPESSLLFTSKKEVLIDLNIVTSYEQQR